MMKNKGKRRYYTIAEHLSEGNMAILSKLRNVLIGKYVKMCVNKSSITRRYSLPTYFIKDVDVTTSQLIVHPINAKIKEKIQSGYDDEITVYNYETDFAVEKRLKITMSKDECIKLGTIRIGSYDMLETLPTEERVTTWQRYYD